ncbi:MULTISPECIES: flagellar hook basal-body protein [Pseudoxanthomonas]|uniref:Flagellar basal-body rod protein FlgF n=1 Tax=Pseudoxanthomonas winnipegensis TaxID=2480810 RepID=A0AAW8GHX4_9GAMM|nr:MULTISPECIES: flagellar hook basal-body protein [Pseudoxanthomonas]MDQ1120678.1 flagellar basal-body rod protein FlgF [Pseudoxanthomonas winnipegensis]MDQ1133901.1 flagellar basal-body rod protein FlgF [Pseudoxanthomonas winnipegensis]MDR6139863.1 flagellar basal-body rod protein FlgF [Pseudoxanthomonas sp. SORGH_AS_0997]
MTDALEALGRSISQDVQRLTVLSNNVANVSTPGFRRSIPVSDFGQSLQMQGVIEQRDGGLRETGRPLDLALRGEGFLQVQSPGGVLLVRAGALQRLPDGTLATPEGHPVLGESGYISLPPGPVRVDKDGVISVDGQRIDKLAIVVVGDARRLMASDGGFTYDGPSAEWKGTVLQGAVERSNVDAASETVSLMELTRHVESLRSAFSVYDKTLDTGINRIGQE